MYGTMSWSGSNVTKHCFFDLNTGVKCLKYECMRGQVKWQKTEWCTLLQWLYILITMAVEVL